MEFPGPQTDSLLCGLFGRHGPFAHGGLKMLSVLRGSLWTPRAFGDVSDPSGLLACLEDVCGHLRVFLVLVSLFVWLFDCLIVCCCN